VAAAPDDNRWVADLRDRAIALYVATGVDGPALGFAARRDDELLHFGTAPETWGSGLATWLRDALVEAFPPEVQRLRLWVLAGNGRGRRLYEKLGWTLTGAERRTSYPPPPVLVEYERRRSAGSGRSLVDRGPREAGVLGRELADRAEDHQPGGGTDGGQ
jgi:RimJ/RimL family protein N-acetyltransferase